LGPPLEVMGFQPPWKGMKHLLPPRRVDQGYNHELGRLWRCPEELDANLRTGMSHGLLLREGPELAKVLRLQETPEQDLQEGMRI
jgi:hypothetical protein